MKETAARLASGLTLLVAASAILLFSDLGSRHPEPPRRTNAETGSPAPEPGATYHIALAYFMPEPSRDTCEQGLLDGLRALGFVEGKNLSVLRAHAQGETANIATIVRNFDSLSLDAMVTFSTPVLQAALAAVRNTPVVFTYCVDPIAAGVGKSFTDHNPNFTGVGSLPPIADSVTEIRKYLPQLRTLGTIFNNNEANSRRILALLRDVCREQGITLVERPADTPGDVVPAAQALVTARVDAIYIPNDNTAAQAFDGIVQTATRARIPTMSADPDDLGRGVLLAVGVGFYHSGYAAARPLARVITGESPAVIPIENVSVSTALYDPAVAKKLGL